MYDHDEIPRFESPPTPTFVAALQTFYDRVFARRAIARIARDFSPVLPEPPPLLGQCPVATFLVRHYGCPAQPSEQSS